jgi:hypothetical protein
MLTHDLLVARQEQHEHNQRRSEDAVYDSGPEEHFDRIESGKIEPESDRHRHGDDGVKLLSKARVFLKRAYSVRGFSDGVSMNRQGRVRQAPQDGHVAVPVEFPSLPVHNKFDHTVLTLYTLRCQCRDKTPAGLFGVGL